MNRHWIPRPSTTSRRQLLRDTATGFGSLVEEEAWSMRVALLDAFIYTPSTR